MGDDQKQMKKRLKVLMNRPENQVCSDCPERQPRWASLIVPPPGAPQGSLPIGAFCCLECSGSHRRLGVHISFVRSVNLDSWKEKEVLAMENGGNTKVNAIFEARLNVPKPSNHADGSTRERFIRDKYERRKFYDPSAFERLANQPPAPAPKPAPQQQSSQEMPPLSSSHHTQSSASVGVPSAAARKRLESRRSNLEGNASAGWSTPSKGRILAPSSSGVSTSSARSKSSTQEPVGDLLDFNAATSEPASKRSVHQRRKSNDLLGFPDDPMQQAGGISTKSGSKKKTASNSGGTGKVKQDDFADFATSSSHGGDFGDLASSNASAATSSSNNTSNKTKNDSSNAAQSIMSLYNAGPGNPQSFAGNNNMMNMTSMMQQMNMNNSTHSTGSSASALTPQAMQQQAMMYQQHMMRLQQMQRQQQGNGMGMMMMMNQNNPMNYGIGGGGMNPMGMMGGMNNNAGNNMGGGMNNMGMGGGGMNNMGMGMGGMNNMGMMGGQQQGGQNNNNKNSGNNDPFASLSARSGF